MRLTAQNGRSRIERRGLEKGGPHGQIDSINTLKARSRSEEEVIEVVKGRKKQVGWKYHEPEGKC